MAYNLDYTSTADLLAAYKEERPATTFLKDRYFPDGINFATNEVIVEYKKGRRVLAPFVAPEINGKIMKRNGYIAKSFEPAMIQPKRALSIDDLKKKGFGEAYYNQLKPHEREVAITIDDLKEMRTMIDLRKEEMASQVLHTNALTMKYYTDDNKLTETKNIDYFIENNTAIYTPTYKWSEDNADIQGDLAAMAEDLRIHGLPATEVLVGRNVARSFLKNKEILDLLNNRRVEIGRWEPHFIYPEATLLTSLNCYGNDLDIISYLGSYENEEGVNVDYIDPDSVIVIAPGCGVTNYGMITQIDYGQSTFTDYVEKEVPLYEVKDQTRSVILKTAPLLQPKNLSPFRVAKVL